MSAAPRSPDVFARRLHVVVGKGGVGKTTVSAALALRFAREGRRTLAIEMDVGGQLPIMLGSPGPAITMREIDRGLSVLSVDGKAALEEYLGLIIPVRRLLQTVFANRVYQYFVAAAPGLKELMTVGKVFYEVTRLERGRPAWDVVVVDAPASGHSLQYLRMPQAAHDTFAPGLVKREAARVMGLLRDEETTAVHMVTLAEEMPVVEMIETHAQLTGELGLPLGFVVANRLHTRTFGDDVLASLRNAAGGAPDGTGALLERVLASAVEESGWAAINGANLARLREHMPSAPIVELPYLFVEEFGRRELEHLGALFAP